MDPASALGVATAALEFLNFGIDVLELCRQIRDDSKGATASNKALEASTTELSGILQELKTTSANTTKAGRRISTIVADCITLSDDLIKLLEEIRGATRRKPQGTFNATFKALRGNKKIEKLRNLLKDKQSLPDTAVNHDVRAKIVNQGQEIGSLNRKVEDFTNIIREHQQKASRSNRLIAQNLGAIESQNNRIEQSVNASRSAVVQDIGGLQKDVRGRFDALQMQKVKDVFIKSLFYPEHEARRSMIKPAWHQTFEWVFDGQAEVLRLNNSAESWSNFPKWLREGSSLYWISGKAASGKSTLMAHIFNEPATKINLQICAAGKPLHMLCFFFWRPGSTLEKTVQGLLRSLLLKILQVIPELAQLLALEYLISADIVPAWSEKQLTTMFKRAMEIADTLKYCFGIFIDGLDEFDGDVDELVSMILQIQGLPHIKCCVSSRRNSKLLHHLSGYASLRLEELNRNDIIVFVRGKLDSYDLTTKVMDELAIEIGARANGVFLWAFLTTQSIRKGITSHDDLDILLQRLDTYPRDMNALFESMLADVDEVHRESLSFYLRATMMLSRQFELSYGLPGIALLTASRGHSPIDYQCFIERCEQTKKQIIAQSRGLLEIQAGGYAHHMLRRLESSSDVQRQLFDESRSRSLWILPQSASHGSKYVSLETPEGRQRAFSTRYATAFDLQMARLLAYEEMRPRFVHRSAYDFILLHKTKRMRWLLDKTSDAEVAQRVANGSMKLYAALPFAGPPRHPVIQGHDWNDHPASMIKRFGKTYRMIQAVFHHSPEQTYACLMELEALIDQLHSDTLRAYEAKLRVEMNHIACCAWERPLNDQLSKAMFKLCMWNCAMVHESLEHLRASIPRILENPFGTVVLAILIGPNNHGMEPQHSIPVKLDMLQALQDFYPRPLRTTKVRK